MFFGYFGQAVHLDNCTLRVDLASTLCLTSFFFHRFGFKSLTRYLNIRLASVNRSFITTLCRLRKVTKRIILLDLSLTFLLELMSILLVPVVYLVVHTTLLRYALDEHEPQLVIVWRLFELVGEHLLHEIQKQAGARKRLSNQLLWRHISLGLTHEVKDLLLAHLTISGNKLNIAAFEQVH